MYVGSVHTSGARVLLIPPITDTKLKNDKLKMTTWSYIILATRNYLAILIDSLLREVGGIVGKLYCGTDIPTVRICLSGGH